jgi:hypothetical protein
MPQTGLKGPFSLNKETIESVASATPGVYVLGYVEIGGDFIPKYVGRSDANINQSLKEWANTEYSKFKFECCDSPQSAFVKECRLYHDWKEQLNNQEHPRKLDNRWNCPCCKLFESGSQK